MTRHGMRRLGLGIAGGLLLAASSALADGPFQFFTLTPCRVVDTRNPNGPTGGPSLTAQANPPRSFPIRGSCGIPVTAKAVVFNVAVVAPTGSGNLRIWPYNTTMPLVATINFDAGEPAIANGAIAPLANDATAQISVFLQSGLGNTSDLVLDVTGYFQ
jgi:hypothetical protein